MAEDIYTQLGIDKSKLKRDYIKNPLFIDPCGKHSEKPYKDDLVYLYIDINLSLKLLVKIFNCSISTINRWLKYYFITKSKDLCKLNREKSMIQNHGVKCSFMSKIILNKRIETWKHNYNTDNPSKCYKIQSKMKNTCKLKYGTDWAIQNDFILNKAQNTKKRNHTYKSSKQEDLIYNVLKNKFKKVLRQYCDKRYPHRCDFYIPKKDLFIEYQGCESHCKEPFICSNKQIIKLKQMYLKSFELNSKGIRKFKYLNYIKTWIYYDVIKRNDAKENNLNWIEFFSIDDFMNWYNKQ